MKAFRHERGIEAVFSPAARVAGCVGKVLPTYGQVGHVVLSTHGQREHVGREHFPAAAGGRRHGYFIEHGYFIAEARP